MSSFANCGLLEDGDFIDGQTQFFFIVMGALVFFMQAGFALLEAGSTGSTSVTSILFKNMCDVLIGAVAWWAVGYAFAYGTEYKFIGSSGYFLANTSLCNYADWFYQWTFAATAVTIVSGAMAGRTQLKAYAVYSIFITGFVYPVVVHWTWSGKAWLYLGNDFDLSDTTDPNAYTDYAGSGIVHATGGTAALIGAYWVGPRGTDQFENYPNKADIPGHSMPLVALGTFILFFGFIGFNGGSVLSGSAEAAPVMSLAVVNTVMAAAGGGLCAEAINYFALGRKYWSLMQMCNGLIAGMVAICAGANQVYPWAAFVIGIGGGASYKLWSWGVRKCGIDDAIDAGAVHLGAGLWGLVAVALFRMDPWMEASVNTAIGGMDNSIGGIFYSSDSKDAWMRLAWNLAGGIVIMVWTGALTTIMFATLHYFGSLRVQDSAINGVGGLDFHEHGEMAYVHYGVSMKRRHDTDPAVVISESSTPPRGIVKTQI